jgi:segregation and condensation protein A
MEHQEFESILEGYPVHLDAFEGPLDLLLHLIKKHEVNIYDIPIVQITRQYLDYIDLMQELNLDVAGEFLVMAATLIHIKSRMLLPRADPAQEDPDEDPREALMRRLLEHQKFKAAAELLHERETLRSAQWTRPDGPINEIAGEAPEPEVEVDLFSLITAFRAVVERAKQRPKVYLPSEQIPIEDRIEQLMAKLSETEACGFEDLFADVQSRAGMIVTFLAMLEMIRLKLIRVFQSGSTGPIRVYKRARPTDAPKPLLDPEKRHADEVAAHDAAQAAQIEAARGAEVGPPAAAEEEAGAASSDATVADEDPAEHVTAGTAPKE